MRDEKFLILKILVLVITFVFSACQKSVAENNNLLLPQTSPSISPTLDLSPTPTPISETPIRKIDFENFTYPGTEDFPETFTLRKGEKPFEYGKEEGIYLGKTEYSDVTNDGQEYAILTMSIQTGGSAMPNLIYIYTLRKNKPKLLWGFMTGDRAEGGLKKVYAESGNLIVELFGDDNFEKGKWSYDIAEGKFNGLCCPTTFTKFRFGWDGEKFVVEGKPELFDYDWRKQPDK